ncbi:hypothetical protein D9M72_544940 [compost metagenome]
MAQSQKPSRARWCSTQAATAAVTSGSSAVTTAAWLAVTTRSAKASRSGKPMQLPSTAMPSGFHWCAAGRGERVTSRKMADSTPASAARPSVTNHGDSCGASCVPVASRVIGSVMANSATPTTPSHMPSVSSLRASFIRPPSTRPSRPG